MKVRGGVVLRTGLKSQDEDDPDVFDEDDYDDEEDED